MCPTVPRRVLALAIVLAAASLAACQKPDVGARCVLSWNEAGNPPPPTPQTAGGDYFETGNVGCDDLVCIVSQAEPGTRYGDCAGENGEACGYCSKPCVSNADCYASETGLVCDRVVLDETFVRSLDPEVRERYLGQIQFSRYCVSR